MIARSAAGRIEARRASRNGLAWAATAVMAAAVVAMFVFS